MIKCENGNPNHLDYDPAVGKCPECAKRAARPTAPPFSAPSQSATPKVPHLPVFPPTEYIWEVAQNSDPSAPRELFDPVAGWLVVVDGPGQGRYHPVFFGRNTIGREPKADVLLMEDKTLSQEIHCILTYDYELRKYEVESGDPQRSRMIVFVERKPRFEFNPWTGEQLLTKISDDKYEPVQDFGFGLKPLRSRDIVELTDEWIWLIKVGKTTLRLVAYNEPLMRWRTT